MPSRLNSCLFIGQMGNYINDERIKNSFPEDLDNLLAYGAMGRI